MEEVFIDTMCGVYRRRPQSAAVVAYHALKRSSDFDGAWRLHPQVAVRPEDVGALRYHFGTRRLSSLKSPAVLSVVTETASVHDSGSQAALWAPSRVGETDRREVPVQMEQRGVEVDASVGAVLRQFHPGLTNSRTDDYGTDRPRLTREVRAVVRHAIGPNRVLSLRLSCDALAPWAGVTPEAAEQAAELVNVLDLLVVFGGSPYSATGYRPDSRTPPAFNTELAHAVRGAVPVALEGTVVEVDTTPAALDDGAADLVERTRAQIADAHPLVLRLRAETPERIRHSLLCNQTSRVRDNRNPIVTCVGDPRSGHETQDPDPNWHDLSGHVKLLGYMYWDCVIGGRWIYYRMAAMQTRLSACAHAIRPAMPEQVARPKQVPGCHRGWLSVPDSDPLTFGGNGGRIRQEAGQSMGFGQGRRGSPGVESSSPSRSRRGLIEPKSVAHRARSAGRLRRPFLAEPHDRGYIRHRVP